MMVLISLIENQTMKLITFTSSQTTSPSITKQLPQSIEKWLSQLSSPEDIFHETTQYEQCLSNCGHNEKLTYQ